MNREERKQLLLNLGRVAYDAHEAGGQQNFGPWDDAPAVVREVHDAIAAAVCCEVLSRLGLDDDELEFTYCAELRLVEGVRRREGSVRATDWEKTHLTTKHEAAWAFVRGLCDRPGEWLCRVKLPRSALHIQFIDVEEFDGALLRKDRPLRP